MRSKGMKILLTFWLLSLVTKSNASLGDHLIRRQSSEAEPESTTPKSQPQQAQPPRLYPDLPQAPTGSIRPLNGPFGPPFPASAGPTPYLPFGVGPMPGNRLGDTRSRLQSQPMTQFEKQQSQTFTSGLGRRLLSLAGVQSPFNESMSEDSQSKSAAENAVKALQNSTVLLQLNKGVQTIYGGLSKMYNETVQQQLELLQEKFGNEIGNSTNPWQQRMAQQVSGFFKSMASKVDQAQNNLNRAWQDFNKASNGSTINGTMQNDAQRSAPHRSFFNSFDNFFHNGDQDGNFFTMMGRNLGFGGDQYAERQNSGQSNGNTDLASQLRYFWHNQVQPQVNMVRGQVARVWRDLTASGALVPESVVRARSDGNSIATGQKNGSSSDLLNEILKEVDMSTSDYALVEPKNDNQQGQNQPMANTVGSQLMNRLISMQRDVNQLWMGLTNSLQNALVNARANLNPRQRFEPASGPNDIDPAKNEIDDKIKDLSKLQKEADAVYTAVQQKQEEPRRPSIGDRFRDFFNGVEQLPGRFSL